MEHDGNTEVLVEGMGVWRRLIWMREEVCEKDGLWIKKGAVLEQSVLDNPGSWEAEVLAKDPELRDCWCESGVPLPLMLAGAASHDVELFAGEAPFCCKASSLTVRSLTASCNCTISLFCLSDKQP